MLELRNTTSVSRAGTQRCGSRSSIVANAASNRLSHYLALMHQECAQVLAGISVISNRQLRHFCRVVSQKRHAALSVALAGEAVLITNPAIMNTIEVLELTDKLFGIY